MVLFSHGVSKAGPASNHLSTQWAGWRTWSNVGWGGESTAVSPITAWLPLDSGASLTPLQSLLGRPAECMNGSDGGTRPNRSHALQEEEETIPPPGARL